MSEEIVIKIHAFPDAINFCQFWAGFSAEWSKESKDKVADVTGAFKTYTDACCNKQTWLNILTKLYEESITKHKDDTELWKEIKVMTKCDKLMVFSNNKLLLEV